MEFSQVYLVERMHCHASHTISWFSAAYLHSFNVNVVSESTLEYMRVCVELGIAARFPFNWNLCRSANVQPTKWLCIIYSPAECHITIGRNSLLTKDWTKLPTMKTCNACNCIFSDFCCWSLGNNWFLGSENGIQEDQQIKTIIRYKTLNDCKFSSVPNLYQLSSITSLPLDTVFAFTLPSQVLCVNKINVVIKIRKSFWMM